MRRRPRGVPSSTMSSASRRSSASAGIEARGSRDARRSSGISSGAEIVASGFVTIAQIVESLGHVLPLVTERLVLRAMRSDEVDGLAEIYLDPRVMHWIGPHTRGDVEHEVARQLSYQQSFGWSLWAVEDRETGRLIGDCGLQPLEHAGPEVELGYDFHPDVWGRGLATEAARAVMAAAFGALAIPEVVAVVKPAHVASQRVLEKVGLARMGACAAYGEIMVLYKAVGVPRTSRR